MVYIFGIPHLYILSILNLAPFCSKIPNPYFEFVRQMLHHEYSHFHIKNEPELQVSPFISAHSWLEGTAEILAKSKAEIDLRQ